MRRILPVFLAFLLLLWLLSLCMTARAADAPRGADFRAVWVSTVLNLDYPAVPSVSAEALARQADEILDRTAELGFTAVFLQVRPAADAIYPSAVFPWSHYLTGEAGRAPDGGFDPLDYWCAGAHARGLELHAWINPYRVTKNTTDYTVAEPGGLPAGSPAREHPEWVIEYRGDFYFDPALPEVRALVTDGVREILERYPVDGVHLDDYFYPGQDFDDSASYARLGGGQALDDWRRDNVTALIRSLRALTAEYPGVSFGVSPAGIWANRTTDPRGSETAGGEAFTQHYADTRLWVEEELLDYICPQIYWHIGHESADYAALAEWWSALCRGSPVRLYIGMAAYRVDGAGEAAAWQGTDELIRQLELNRTLTGIDGEAFFRYGSFASNPALSQAVRTWFDEHRVYPLAVRLPERDTVTETASYYVGGSSDPREPLYLNGEPVENRSENGFFGVLVPLEPGANVLSFTQGDHTARRVIRRAERLPDYGAAGILSDAFPAFDRFQRPGDTVELSVTAPLGAVVKAEFLGRSFPLAPDRHPGSGATTCDTAVYRARVTLPGRSGTVEDLGAPVYTLRWRDTRLRLAGRHILLAADRAALTARMETDVWAYAEASSAGGPASLIAAGMSDRVVKLSGAYLGLSSGLWVRAQDVRVLADGGTETALGAVRFEKTGAEESLFCKGGSIARAELSADGRVLTFRAAPARDAPIPDLTDSALFSSVTADCADGCAVYRLTLREDAIPGGVRTAMGPDGCTLTVTARRGAADDAFPLRAHTIVLDAGHGGEASGALGLLGADRPEKDVNLLLTGSLAEKLRSLGATVIETRTEDADLTLEERSRISRGAEPDLFLSIHCNALAADADAGTARGFSVYYREEIARDCAETLYAACRETLGPDTGLHRRNFYVCRGSWCPALLFEAAFMTNPEDFEILLHTSGRDRITDALTEGILRYFSGNADPA